jgi:hypothetical protein
METVLYPFSPYALADRAHTDRVHTHTHTHTHTGRESEEGGEERKRETRKKKTNRNTTHTPIHVAKIEKHMPYMKVFFRSQVCAKCILSKCFTR